MLVTEHDSPASGVVKELVEILDKLKERPLNVLVGQFKRESNGTCRGRQIMSKLVDEIVRAHATSDLQSLKQILPLIEEFIEYEDFACVLRDDQRLSDTIILSLLADPDSIPFPLLGLVDWVSIQDESLLDLLVESLMKRSSLDYHTCFFNFLLKEKMCGKYDWIKKSIDRIVEETRSQNSRTDNEQMLLSNHAFLMHICCWSKVC